MTEKESILVTVGQLIDEALGPYQCNTVDFKLIHTILLIIAKELRILERRIEVRIGHRKATDLTPSFTNISLTEIKLQTRKKKTSGDSLESRVPKTKKPPKHYDLDKAFSKMSEITTKEQTAKQPKLSKQRPKTDTKKDQTEARSTERSLDGGGSAIPVVLDEGKQAQSAPGPTKLIDETQVTSVSSASIDEIEEELEELEGGSSQTKVRGKKKTGTGQKVPQGRGGTKLDHAKGKTRDQTTKDAKRVLEKVEAQREKVLRIIHQRADSHDEPDIEPQPMTSAMSLPSQESDIQQEKILIVERVSSGESKTSRSAQHMSRKTHIGRLSIVTQEEFEKLQEVVRQLAFRLKGIAGPEFPDSEKLMLELRKGASLTDAMAVFQLAARLEAAEKALFRMTELLAEVASSVPGGMARGPAGIGIAGGPSVMGMAGGPTGMGMAGGPAGIRIAGGPAGTGMMGAPAGMGMVGGPAGMGMAGGPAGTGMAGGPAGIGFSRGSAGMGMVGGPAGMGMVGGPAGMGLAAGPAGMGMAGGPAGSGMAGGPAGMGMAGGPAGMGMAGGPAGMGMTGGPAGMGMAGGPAGMRMTGGPAGLGMAGGPAGMGIAAGPAGMGMAGGPAGMGMAGGPADMGMAGGPAGMGMAGGPAGMGMAGGPAGMGMAGGPAGMGMAGGPAGMGMAGGPAGMGMAGGPAGIGMVGGPAGMGMAAGPVGMTMVGGRSAGTTGTGMTFGGGLRQTSLGGLDVEPMSMASRMMPVGAISAAGAALSKCVQPSGLFADHGADSMTFEKPGQKITAEQLMDKLMSLQDEFTKSVNNMSKKVTDVASHVVTTTRNLEERINSLDYKTHLQDVENFLASYAERITKLDTEYSSQLTDFQEKLTQMQFDLEVGLDSMMEALANTSGDPAAVAELNNKFTALQFDFDSIVGAQQDLHNYESKLGIDLQTLYSQVEVLKGIKCDREEVEDALKDKAGISTLNGLVTLQQFDSVRGDFEKKISKSYDKFNSQEIIWQRAIDDVSKELNEKADIVQLTSLRDDVNFNIKKLNSKLQELSDIVGEPRAVAVSRKLFRDTACISCSTPAKMDFVEHSMELPALPANRPPVIGAEAHAELCPKEDGDHGVCYVGWPIPHQLDQRAHICRRYCGGSHTLLPKVGKPLEGVNVKPLTDPRRDSPNELKLEKKLCKPCNIPKSKQRGSPEEAMEHFNISDDVTPPSALPLDSITPLTAISLSATPPQPMD